MKMEQSPVNALIKSTPTLNFNIINVFFVMWNTVFLVLQITSAHNVWIASRTLMETVNVMRTLSLSSLTVQVKILEIYTNVSVLEIWFLSMMDKIALVLIPTIELVLAHVYAQPIHIKKIVLVWLVECNSANNVLDQVSAQLASTPSNSSMGQMEQNFVLVLLEQP